MIPVSHPITEPADFETNCREKGRLWLAGKRLAGKNPKTSEYPNYWAGYEDDLAKAFHHRCGWWAMWIAEGDVEHFLSRKNHPDEAYEWRNYRYIAGSVNGSKGNHDDKVLDPFEVQDGWFEVLLPSMQLVATANLPPALAEKAKFTLNKLRLRNGTKVVRSRKRWFESYKNGTPFSELEKFAPLVAMAVSKFKAAGRSLP